MAVFVFNAPSFVNVSNIVIGRIEKSLIYLKSFLGHIFHFDSKIPSIDKILPLPKAFFNIGLSINLILFLAIVQVAFSHLLITTEVASTPPPHFSFNIPEKGKNQLKLVWAHVF